MTRRLTDLEGRLGAALKRADQVKSHSHRWQEITGEYFENLYKCLSCEMVVEASDRQNWTTCESK